MFKLGLTGAIGMGKSTTAAMFAELGCEIWDADAAVHRLYSSGGAAVAPMQAQFPQVVEDNTVSRAKLRILIANDPSALKSIEQIVHPLLGQDRSDFVKNAKSDILVYHCCLKLVVMPAWMRLLVFGQLQKYKSNA